MNKLYTEIKNSRPFRIMDAVIAAVLIGALVFFVAFNRPATGSYAEIYRAGKLVKTMPLNIDAVYEYECEGKTNTITVKDGKISVTDSGCPDKICMNMSGAAGFIICLPHKLLIKICGNAEYDGVIY